MADKTDILPPLKDSSTPTPLLGSDNTNIIVDVGGGAEIQPTGKDYVISGGIVLIAAVIWFVVKNAYADWLISSQKRSPNQGNAAGWGLFGALFFPTFGAALGFVNSARFLSLPYLIPIGLATLVCLVLTLVISMKK